MPCVKPMTAFRKNGGGITFDRKESFADLDELTLPCGQCLGCRIDQSADWANRIMNEVRMNEISCFLTLTYNNDTLPTDGSLNKTELQDFIKRLRKTLEPETIRYFACGEYGDQTQRPHYHVIIFGYMPGDKKYVKTSPSGFKIYQSERLDKIWKNGFVGINEISFDLAQYCAKYVTKKLPNQDTFPEDLERRFIYRGREPEFGLMSRRPGIGSSYYDKYKKEIWSNDSLINDKGREFQPPLYYFRKLEEEDPKLALKIKQERYQNAKKLDPLLDRERIYAKGQFLYKKQKLFSNLYKQEKL
jgi:hypothetical protein